MDIFKFFECLQGIIDENKYFEQGLKIDKAAMHWDVYKLQCFPLYSILLAVGRTDIDFISLDVEGSEYKILETIPWYKVDIKVSIHLLYSHFPTQQRAPSENCPLSKVDNIISP